MKNLMIWAERLLIASPLAVAAALNILIKVFDRPSSAAQRIAGYGFAFGTPWALLLDHGRFGNIHSRWLETMISSAVILWIPAFLYSGCLWLLVRVWHFRVVNRLLRPADE